MFARLISFAVFALALTSCATDVRIEPETGRAKVAFQDNALNPRNGGQAIDTAALRPGDILLSSSNGMTSAGIRLMTASPVSHASIYVGDSQIAEAVGEGIQRRSVAALLDEESNVVAFRHPGLQPEHALKMESFVKQHVGEKYNYVGVVLQAPFSIERRVCELPVVPSPLRDFCIQGV